MATYEQPNADELQKYREALGRNEDEFSAGDIGEQDYFLRRAYLTLKIKLLEELADEPAERDSA